MTLLMQVTLTQKHFAKILKVKSIVECYDLLADVFKNFQSMCLAIYELDPAHFLSPTGLI